MNVIPRILALLLALTFCWGCSQQTPGETGSGMSLDAIADAYVRLVLEMGNHDEAFVDAYYGPEQWREEARGSGSTLDEIDARAGELLAALEAEPPPAAADELLSLRHHYLSAQLRALRVRKSLIAGKRLSFDEESLALYDAVAPSPRVARCHSRSSSAGGSAPRTTRLDAPRQRDGADLMLNVYSISRNTDRSWVRPKTSSFSSPFRRPRNFSSSRIMSNHRNKPVR